MLYKKGDRVIMSLSGYENLIHFSKSKHTHITGTVTADQKKNDAVRVQIDEEKTAHYFNADYFEPLKRSRE